MTPTNDLWQVDEIYIKVKGKDRYLYRAVETEGKYTGLFADSETGCISSETVFPQNFAGDSYSRVKSD